MGIFMNLCVEKFKCLIRKYVFHVICLKKYFLGAKTEYLFALYLVLLANGSHKQNHQANLLVQTRVTFVCWKEKTWWLQLVSLSQR